MQEDIRFKEYKGVFDKYGQTAINNLGIHVPVLGQVVLKNVGCHSKTLKEEVFKAHNPKLAKREISLKGIMDEYGEESAESSEDEQKIKRKLKEPSKEV